MSHLFKNEKNVQEPWSNAFVRRLLFYGFVFESQKRYTLIYCKNCNFVFKRLKISEKEVRYGPFYKNWHLAPDKFEAAE